MKNIRRAILQILLGWILLFLSACSSSDSIQPVLEKADLYMEEHPDSALALLEAIPFEACSRESQKAYYNLLLTQAFDKNIKSLENAPIASAVAYYERSSDPLKKALAFFYQGRQYEDKKQNEQATHYFIKALTAIHFADNKKYEALLCSHLGSVNSNKMLFHKSLEYHKKALHLFKEINDSNNYVCALLDVGYAHFYLENMDSAFYYTKEALSGSEIVHNCELYNVPLSNLSAMYCSREEYEKALQTISSLQGEEKESHTTYSILSTIYLHLHQYDLAENCLQHCLEDKSVYAQGNAYNSLSTLEKMRGNWKQAFLYKEKYEEYADSAFFQDNGVKLAEIQEKYQNQILAHEKELLSIRKQRNEWMLVGVVLVITMISIFLFYRNQKQEYQKERYIVTLKQRISEYEEKILQIQNAYLQHTKELRDLSEQHLNDKKSLMEEKERIVQEWQHLMIEQEKNQQELAILQKVKITTGELNETMNLVIHFLDIPSAVRILTQEELYAIEQLVIKLFAPSYTKLIRHSRLSVHEKQLWCLFQLGFSHASIAAFLNITPSSVSTAKLRLKRKIQKLVQNEVDKIFL